MTLLDHCPAPARHASRVATADIAQIATAVALLDHATSPDMRLTIVKDADHRFSDDTCLGLIKAAVEEVSG